MLIETPQGNVLWDCITFLDYETIQWVHSHSLRHSTITLRILTIKKRSVNEVA